MLTRCRRQQYLFIPAKHKDCYTAYVLNELSGCTAMIFTRTCEATRRLALLLRALGFDAVPIHGNMSQPKRLGCVFRVACITIAMHVADARPLTLLQGSEQVQGWRAQHPGCD